MTADVLKEFSGLAPFVDAWSLATEDERRAKRKSSTKEELQDFYKAMLPELEKILDLADQYPKGQIPPEVETYFFMALSLAEVAPHIELYNGNPNVPYSFTEERFIALHGKDRG